jgi:iron(III) transport system substrate-binding protein
MLLAGIVPGNAAEGGFAESYDAVVAAAAKEDPVRLCTAGLEEEVAPVLAAFHETFPNVPQPVWERCNGVERRERILTEYAAGQVMTDVFEASDDLMQRIEDSDFAARPNWALFDGTPLEIPKDSHNEEFVAGGALSPVLVYNTKLLSEAEAPKSFEDCADPKWKGQLMVDVRPVSFTPFIKLWGEEKLRAWAKGVAANDPMWTRSSAAFAQLASGEKKFHCGFNLAGFLRAQEGGAKDIAFRFATETPVKLAQIMMVAKDTPSPNGALLLTAFWASKPGQLKAAEGNPGYGSPYLEGTWKYDAVKKAGDIKLFQAGWDNYKYADTATSMMVEEWGFPQPTK